MIVGGITVLRPTAPGVAPGTALPAGPQGQTGAASTIPGPSGPQGMPGPQGASSTVPGPTGPLGPQGFIGATGPQGADSTVPGPIGATGPTGVAGAQGAAGPAGQQGATGATGPQGPSGSSAIDTILPQGRLTLTSGVPVLTGTVAAAGTIYYTPYVGHVIPLWNGSAFVPTQFAEVSQALSDTTKSPSAAAAGQVYDLFGWLDGSTFRMTRGPAWSAGATAGSNAARGLGVGSTTLARINGVLVNQYAVAGGPAAGYGTYVGTIATDAGGATVTWNPGSAAAGGGAATLGVWNMYNRRVVKAQVTSTTATHSGSGTSYGLYGASATWRCTFVYGLAEDYIRSDFKTMAVPGSGGTVYVSIGFNSTTVPNTTAQSNLPTSFSNLSTYNVFSTIGLNYVQALENNAANPSTYYDAGYAVLTADLMM